MPFHLNIDTVQGVGDTYWVWQKLYHHCDSMSFRVMVTDQGNKVQSRCLDFLRILEKVSQVETVHVSQREYDLAAAIRRPMFDVLHSGGGVYGVNAPLEVGIRLEAIDPDYTVQWEPKFSLPEEKQPRHSILYVSGSIPRDIPVWPAACWAEFYAKLWNKDPVLLLGAPYDDVVLHRVQDELEKLGVPSFLESCTSASNALRYLRDSSQFIGYNSGLGILADAFDIPSVMVYFPHLQPMKYAWCKPHHIAKTFRAITFEQNYKDLLQ